VTTEREEIASAAACMKDTPLYISCMGSGGEKSGVIVIKNKTSD
jgi:hypothetical protein